MKQKKSAAEIMKKGAQGAILSNRMPPTKLKSIMPSAPKKNATPCIVPLISAFMFL